MNIIRIPGLADYQETLRMQEELVRAHQDDPERVYGLSFSGWEVKFRVEGVRLYVLALSWKC